MSNTARSSSTGSSYQIEGSERYAVWHSYLAGIAIRSGIPKEEARVMDILSLQEVAEHTAAGFGGVAPFEKEKEKKGFDFNSATPEEIEMLKSQYKRKK